MEDTFREIDGLHVSVDVTGFSADYSLARGGTTKTTYTADDCLFLLLSFKSRSIKRGRYVNAMTRQVIIFRKLSVRKLYIYADLLLQADVHSVVLICAVEGPKCQLAVTDDT